jgi:radical SAM protein with 4Fe4S-binding SPASM domain
LVGCLGAFQRMRAGVDRVIARGMKVEINVCTFQGNYTDLFDIARVMAQDGVHVFCVTRYIMVAPEGADHVLNAPQTIAVLDALERIKAELPTYAEVKLPGPVPYCELPPEQWDRLRHWNTPCQVGYGLCRISPVGCMTPCPLSDDVVGNVRERSFAALWADSAWARYVRLEHLPANCRSCGDLETCRGGCVFYDDSLKSCGHTPKTLKWGA